MISETTRRFEHGIPLLATLSPQTLLRAWGQVVEQNPLGLLDLITGLGPACDTRTLRRLSAIYRATDSQLLRAESDPSVLKALEEDAAERSLKECFDDAMSFFIGAAEQLGITLGYSAAAETEAEKTKEAVAVAVAASNSDS